ncbi:hypothetical protein [Ekhidna sp.]
MKFFTNILCLLLITFGYSQLKKDCLLICNDINSVTDNYNKNRKSLTRLETVIARFDKRLFGKKNSEILRDYRTSAHTYYVLKMMLDTTKNPCIQKVHEFKKVEKFELDTFPSKILTYEPKLPKSKVDQLGQFLSDLSARAHLIDTINYMNDQKSYEALIELVNNTNALRKESQQSWLNLMCQFYLQDKMRLEMAKNEMEQHYRRAILKFSKQ